MPRLTGFEVIEALEPAQIPVVIFTTAHDEHAIRAFEVNALDYLLNHSRGTVQNSGSAGTRPIGKERPARALLADRRIGESCPYRNSRRRENPGPLAGTYCVSQAGRYRSRRSRGHYVILHAGKERHIVRETTAAMEARLNPAGFMRISRSLIVNLARIREVQPVGPSQYSVLFEERNAPGHDLQLE